MQLDRALNQIKGHVLHKLKDLLRHPYVRRLGLTKPAVGKFNKDKIFSTFYFQVTIYFLMRMSLYEMHFTTSYSTLGRRKYLHNSNINLCLKVSQKK